MARLGYTRATVTIGDLKRLRKSISKAQQFSHYYVDPLMSCKGKNDRALTSPCLSKVTVQDKHGQVQNVIHAASHNYAGFYRQTSDSEYLQRLCLDRLPITRHDATPALQSALHEKVAMLFEADFCYTTSTGYGSNLLAFPAILDDCWALIIDEKCHSSMLVGAYQSSCGRIRKIRHNDMEQLENTLQELRPTFDNILVAVEGLYSMDGTIPPLGQLAALKQTYGFSLLADEAHSMNSLGATGRGCVEYWNNEHPQIPLPMDLIDIRTATLSKACGAIGGIVCGKARYREAVRTRHQRDLSEGGEPLQPAAAVQTLHVLGRPTQLERNLRRMRSMICYVRAQLDTFGIYVYGDATVPILPIYTGRPSLAAKLSYTLRRLGVVATPIGPPAVPWWEARVRVCLSVDFDDETVTNLVVAIVEAAQRIRLIPRSVRKPQIYSHSETEISPQESDEEQASKDFIRGLILKDAAKRPTASGVLSDNVIEAGHEGRRRYGLASGAARWIAGTYTVHLEVEKQIAQLAGAEDALTYVDTHLGLMSTVAALSRPVLGYDKHYLLIPENACAAVLDGIKVAPRKGAPTMVMYNSSASVVEQLESLVTRKTHITLYLKSAFAEQAADLLSVLTSWKSSRFSKTGLTILLDSTELPNELPRMDIVKVARSAGAQMLCFGSFNTLFSLPGAYLAGDTLLLNELRYTSRGYMFTTSQLPYVMGMIKEALSKVGEAH